MDLNLLRDYTETTDRRCDALKQFDDRSRAYSISDSLHKRLSKLVPISKIWMAPTCLDQQEEGACVAFATTHALLSEPGVSDPKIYTELFARGKLYYPAQKNDGFPGGEYEGADPVMGGTSVIAVMKEAQKLGLISKYEWAFRFEDLILGLGYHGPAILATDWTTDMMTPNSRGVISIGGMLVGRHSYLVYGVNLRTQMVLCLNSWGPNKYGVQGRFQIPLECVKELLRRAGEAVFITKTGNKYVDGAERL